MHLSCAKWEAECQRNFAEPTDIKYLDSQVHKTVKTYIFRPSAFPQKHCLVGSSQT